MKTDTIVQGNQNDKIFSKRVRAGKRTYFFDVRSTKGNDYYLTITESRRQQREGDFGFEKTKMFLYKEDFNKFIAALEETLNHIKTELNPEYDYDQFSNSELESAETENFKNSDLSWE